MASSTATVTGRQFWRLNVTGHISELQSEPQAVFHVAGSQLATDNKAANLCTLHEPSPLLPVLVGGFFVPMLLTCICNKKLSQDLPRFPETP